MLSCSHTRGMESLPCATQQKQHKQSKRRRKRCHQSDYLFMVGTGVMCLHWLLFLLLVDGPLVGERVISVEAFSSYLPGSLVMRKAPSQATIRPIAMTTLLVQEQQQHPLVQLPRRSLGWMDWVRRTHQPQESTSSSILFEPIEKKMKKQQQEKALLERQCCIYEQELESIQQQCQSMQQEMLDWQMDYIGAQTQLQEAQQMVKELQQPRQQQPSKQSSATMPTVVLQQQWIPTMQQQVNHELAHLRKEQQQGLWKYQCKQQLVSLEDELRDEITSWQSWKQTSRDTSQQLQTFQSERTKLSNVFQWLCQLLLQRMVIRCAVQTILRRILFVRSYVVFWIIQQVIIQLLLQRITVRIWVQSMVERLWDVKSSLTAWMIQQWHQQQQQPESFLIFVQKQFHNFGHNAVATQQTITENGTMRLHLPFQLSSSSLSWDMVGECLLSACLGTWQCLCSTTQWIVATSQQMWHQYQPQIQQGIKYIQKQQQQKQGFWIVAAAALSSSWVMVAQQKQQQRKQQPHLSVRDRIGRLGQSFSMYLQTLLRRQVEKCRQIVMEAFPSSYQLPSPTPKRHHLSPPPRGPQGPPNQPQVTPRVYW